MFACASLIARLTGSTQKKNACLKIKIIFRIIIVMRFFSFCNIFFYVQPAFNRHRHLFFLKKINQFF